MNLIPISYNGLTLNDANFKTVLPGDTAINQSPVEIHYSPRADADPLFAVKMRKEKQITLMIQLLGAAPHAQIDALNAAFDMRQNAEAELLAEDADDGDRQWYLMATPSSQPRIVGALYTITLKAGLGVWRSKTAHSDSWSLTASGQTHSLSPNPVGNSPALPVLRFTPTSGKTANWPYRRLVLVTNQTDSAVIDSIELTAGGLDTASIIGDASRSNQINQVGGITSGATTIPIDTAVGGGLPSSGLGYVDSEQIAWTGNSGSSLTGCTRGLNGTTAAAHADDAVIRLSRMQADGDDLRVIIDGVERDRWLNGINTAATKVWANLSLSPRIELALSGSIAGSGGVMAITFKKSGGWKPVFKRLPSRGTLVIGGEVFSWTSKDETAAQIGGVTRAILGTSMASHSDGDSCKWLEHTAWLVYGDPTLSAPLADDTQRPIIDLTSTNSSHVYTSMTDNTGRRMGTWSPAVLRRRGPESTTYTGNHETDADPASEMGMSIQSWLSGSRYQDENAEMVWSIRSAQGITAVSMTGEKFRSSSAWPATAALEASKDGRKWSQIWDEASPSAVNTWESVTHTSVGLGGVYPFVRFRLKGGVGAGGGYRASFEVNDVTLTLDSAGVPSVSVGAEQSTYDFDLKVTNTTTGETFSLRRQVRLNDQLEVDCTNRIVTNLSNNVRGPLVDRPDNQAEWLRLLPGVTNTIRVEDSGLSGVDVTALYEDRNL